MSNYRFNGTIAYDEAKRLEDAGDVSYRVRVVRTGSTHDVGSSRYATTLSAALAAVDGLAAKWGPYASTHWDRHMVESCDVLIEARERRYNDDGTVMRGMYNKPWRLLERRTVSLAEAVQA